MVGIVFRLDLVPERQELCFKISKVDDSNTIYNSCGSIATFNIPFGNECCSQKNKSGEAEENQSNSKETESIIKGISSSATVTPVDIRLTQPERNVRVTSSIDQVEHHAENVDCKNDYFFVDNIAENGFNRNTNENEFLFQLSQCSSRESREPVTHSKSSLLPTENGHFLARKSEVLRRNAVSNDMLRNEEWRISRAADHRFIPEENVINKNDGENSYGDDFDGSSSEVAVDLVNSVDHDVDIEEIKMEQMDDFSFIETHQNLHDSFDNVLNATIRQTKRVRFADSIISTSEKTIAESSSSSNILKADTKNNSVTLKQSTLICEICDKPCSGKRGLLLHCAKTHRFKSFSDARSKVAKNICLKNIPKNKSNGALYPHSCLKSSKRFGTRLELRNNKNNSSNGVVLCSHCDAVFSSVRDLVLHRNLWHSTPHEKQLSCQMSFGNVQQPCLKSPRGRPHLEKNELEIRIPRINIQKSKFECDKCEFTRTCDGKPSLELLADTHMDGKYYYCTPCTKIFPDRESLKTHEMEQHRSRIGTHTCSVCKRSFKTVIKLRIHERTHTMKPVRRNSRVDTRLSYKKRCWTCFGCDRKFKSKRTMLVHFECHYQKTDSMKCNSCNRSFDNLMLYKIHMKQHLTETCDLCNFKAADSNSLNRHIQNTHRINDLAGKDS